jgi:hypothetical protein
MVKSLSVSLEDFFVFFSQNTGQPENNPEEYWNEYHKGIKGQ